jgi:hypothetical protein
MPIFPPRKEPIKKREQLSQRKKELQYALRDNLSLKKIETLVEKYRMAQLSLLKAKTHELKEKDLGKRKANTNIASIEKEIVYWTKKPAEEIIKEIHS